MRELAAKQTEGVKHLLLSSSVAALLTAVGAPARVQKGKITGFKHESCDFLCFDYDAPCFSEELFVFCNILPEFVV